MSNPKPPHVLSVSIEDAICAVDRLRHFLALLERHADEDKMRDFLLGETEAAAEIADEHVRRIGEGVQK